VLTGVASIPQLLHNSLKSIIINYYLLTARDMKSKPARGRRRLQILHDQTKGDGCAALQQLKTGREMEIQRNDVKNLV